MTRICPIGQSKRLNGNIIREKTEVSTMSINNLSGITSEIRCV